MIGLKGYMGKVLFLDLSKKISKLFPWSDEDRKLTIGGKVMASYILYHHIHQGMKAYDEDNWIVITTSPLTGSSCPNTSRFNISTISPLTNIITSSNCGGDFGLSLKRAGYDACIITGKADRPIMISITDESVEFKSADELWGKTTTETQKLLPGKSGKLVIGPAGEKKVLYASVFSGERVAGRGGVGAVFGDKNLKAVTASGTKIVEVADREKLSALNIKWVKNLRNHPLTGQKLSKLGTAGFISGMQAHSILATKNYSAGRYDKYKNVSGEELSEKHLVSNSGCTTCVIRCTRMVKVGDDIVKGPELEAIGLLGPNILNDNIELICKWNKEIDEYGMDVISVAGSIAFAMELSEKGIFDFGLEFGRTDNISDILYKIAHREGIGDILADGTKRMSEKFGGKEFAINAKGMELAAYEPRHAVGQGLGYATANRGGCHLNAGYMVAAEGLGLDIDSLTTHGKAALTIMFQNLMEGISACGSCLFTSYAVFPSFLVEKSNNFFAKIIIKTLPYFGPVINILNRFPKLPKINIPLIPYTYALRYVTGMKTSLATILTCGALGYNIERISNVILGQKVGADTLPKRLTDIPQDPKNPKTVVPLEILKRTYYKVRGWKDGIPTHKKLKSLGIFINKEYYDKVVNEASIVY